MGYGGYSHQAHLAMTQARSTIPTEKLFQQRVCHPLMNPLGIRFRECRDSPEHPESLGIVFALDVTGSMGEIPERVARRDLPRFMELLTLFQVRDPQILFMAIGDAVGDQAPLQVGQFESTADLMDQWLTWTWLEGGGGKGEHESYELALYFAARHLEMDCLRKRKRRGYLFMTGDEKPYPLLSRYTIKQIVDDDLDLDIPLRSLVREASRIVEPFFLIPDQTRRSSCEHVWREVLGDRVVVLESFEHTCHAAAGLIALNEGTLNLGEVVRQLRSSGLGRKEAMSIARSLTPFAASVDRDAAPAPKLDKAAEVPPPQEI